MSNPASLQTDQRLGYEAGLKGKQRIGNRLFDRDPPEHLCAMRRLEWDRGYRLGIEVRNSKRTFVVFNDGRDVKSYKGHVARRRIVNALEKAGVTGDVIFSYYVSGKCHREITCGI